MNLTSLVAWSIESYQPQNVQSKLAKNSLFSFNNMQPNFLQQSEDCMVPGMCSIQPHPGDVIMNVWDIMDALLQLVLLVSYPIRPEQPENGLMGL